MANTDLTKTDQKTEIVGYTYSPLSPIRRPKDLASLLHSEWFLRGLGEIMPVHDDQEAAAKRVIAQMALAFMRDPQHLVCTQESIVRAALDVAATRLSLSKTMNEACLVRYRNHKAKITELQFQPMYQGLIKLVSRATRVASISAEVVYEGEQFEPTKGTEPKIVHLIDRNLDRSDAKLVAAYAVAHYRAGPADFVVMWRDDIEQVRRVSKQPNAGPWRDWYPEMAKKSAIRRLHKTLPKAEDDPMVELALERALEADNRTYTLHDQEIAQLQERQTQAKEDELARRRAALEAPKESGRAEEAPNEESGPSPQQTLRSKLADALIGAGVPLTDAGDMVDDILPALAVRATGNGDVDWREPEPWTEGVCNLCIDDLTENGLDDAWIPTEGASKQ